MSGIVLSLAVACLSVAGATTTQPQGSLGKARITIASGVRVRALPNTTAEEVIKLGIGTIVDELEKSPARERIGGAEDFWYRIGVPGGKSGWVFGGFTAPFDANNRAAIYLRIAAERLKVEQSGFGEMADLARFLSSAVAEVTQPDSTAELELARLTAIRRAAETIGGEKQDQPPYQAWIKANETLIVYSEPGGQWMIRAEAFWNLAKQYRALAIGERIAWQASQLPLPGECEGDLFCGLSYINQTSGKYLTLYPRGVHAEEAMKPVIEFLSGGLNDLKGAAPIEKEYRASVVKDVGELHAAIQQTASPSKARALELLAPYEKFVRR